MIEYKGKKYKIGICCSVYDFIKTTGFDYLELSMTEIMKWNKSQLEDIKKLRLNIFSANKFFPSNLHIVGNDIDKEKIINYAKTAIVRADTLGIKLIVLGSGKARSYTNDCSNIVARQQMLELLKNIADFAGNRKICIAIEPLEKNTSNLFNTLQETYDFVEECNHPAIKLVADAYHMSRVGDEPQNLYRFRKHLFHFHLCTYDRKLPCFEDNNEEKFFEGLSNTDFVKTISLEANSTDIEEFRRTFLYLNEKYKEC